MSKSITIIELDIVTCALTYGVAPCTAAIGVTGAAKCVNTRNTCQDADNFTPLESLSPSSVVTLRFAQDTDYLPREFDAIPSIQSVSLNPATVSLGQNLGVRGTLTVSFKDHRHSDVGPGFDPYVAERAFNPYQVGTFWSKFRVRQPFLRGRSIRLLRGYEGQSLDEFETRHYVVESFDGPTPDGIYTLIGKDPLKLADNDRSQAPLLNEGFLVASIDDSETSATLSPSGIGNLEYPASGYVAIGGEEIASFTRSGDVLTLTRGQLGTLAVEHDADSRVQVCLRYVGQDPADIISDLLQTYASVPADFIPLSTWQNETATFLQRLYTTTLAEPTGVNKLISELCEQAGLAMGWDDSAQVIRLQVLRGVDTTADPFTEDNVLAGTLRTKEQPDTRISQVWTYFALRNPLEPIDEPENYRSTAVTVDLDAQENQGSPAIKKIYSRWIPLGARNVALRLNDIQLGRFVVPPRRFNFDLFRPQPETVRILGGGRLSWWANTDYLGSPINAPIQITRLNPMADRFQIEAEEMLFQAFDPDDLSDRVIIIDANVNNVNLREVHDSIYPEPTGGESPGITVTCIVETGVVVGSTSNTLPSFDVGSWPSPVPITLRVLGRIQGMGGDGSSGGEDGSAQGSPGGTALYVRYPIDLEVDQGEIWGGGGGGGYAGLGLVVFAPIPGGYGGGGAGTMIGLGAASPEDPSDLDGDNGTADAGGAGGDPGGGDGGGPGLPGQNGTSPGGTPVIPPTDGGAAGNAIDGDSFVTVTSGPGDIRGPTIN